MKQGKAINIVGATKAIVTNNTVYGYKNAIKVEGADEAFVSGNQIFSSQEKAGYEATMLAEAFKSAFPKLELLGDNSLVAASLELKDKDLKSQTRFENTVLGKIVIKVMVLGHFEMPVSQTTICNYSTWILSMGYDR